MIGKAIEKLKRKYVSKDGIKWDDVKNDSIAMAGFGETKTEKRALRMAKHKQGKIDKKHMDSLLDKDGLFDTKVLQNIRDEALEKTEFYKKYAANTKDATPRKLKELLLSKKDILDGKPIDEVNKIIKRIQRRKLISLGATGAKAGLVGYMAMNDGDKND